MEGRIQELSETAEIREEIAKFGEELQHAELLQKMDALLRDRELECLRAVDEERRKWEACKQRLLTQVTEMIITP